MTPCGLPSTSQALLMGRQRGAELHGRLAPDVVGAKLFCTKWMINTFAEPKHCHTPGCGLVSQTAVAAIFQCKGVES